VTKHTYSLNIFLIDNNFQQVGKSAEMTLSVSSPIPPTGLLNKTQHCSADQ
jgi:hypothetical protein